MKRYESLGWILAGIFAVVTLLLGADMFLGRWLVGGML